MMSMCRVFSCVVGRGCLLWPVRSFGKTLLSFAALHSVFQGQMNSMKKRKDRTLNDELPRSVGAQYDNGDQWRNNFRKNEGMVPKQKQHPVVDVTGDRSKVRCQNEQYCIGTWHVRSINQGKLLLLSHFSRVQLLVTPWSAAYQAPPSMGFFRQEYWSGVPLPSPQGKLEVVKQEMARVNINILGIRELKWTGMGEFNSDDHFIYHCGQESLRRNGVAIIVNKRVWNAVLILIHIHYFWNYFPS